MQEYITLSQAWEYVSHTFSYWIWVIVTTLYAGFYLPNMVRVCSDSKCSANDCKNRGIVFILLVVLAIIAWTLRPLEISFNTTVEMAAHGIYKGF